MMSSMSMGKALILTVLLVLSLFVMRSSSQDITSLLDLIQKPQQTSGSSLTAEEIKKVYDEKRKNLDALRKTEVSLLAVEEAIRKYGSNNVLYKQRLEKLKEIATVKRILQNEVSSLMFLCEEKKCNSIKPKEEQKPITTPQVTAPQNNNVAQQSVPLVPMATMTIGPIPLDGERSSFRRSAPPVMSKKLDKEPIISSKENEEIEQIFRPVSKSFSFGEDFPDFEEPSIPEPPVPEEPSIPDLWSGKDKVVKSSAPSIEKSDKAPRKSLAKKKSSKKSKKSQGKKRHAKKAQNNLLNWLKMKKNDKKQVVGKKSFGKKKYNSPKSADRKSAKKRGVKQQKTKSTETAQKKTERAKRKRSKL